MVTITAVLSKQIDKTCGFPIFSFSIDIHFTFSHNKKFNTNTFFILPCWVIFYCVSLKGTIRYLYMLLFKKLTFMVGSMHAGHVYCSGLFVVLLAPTCELRGLCKLGLRTSLASSSGKLPLRDLHVSHWEGLTGSRVGNSNHI